MNSTASARWQGGFKDGKGEVSTGSGTLQAASYAVPARFEGQKGLNPEELLGAAHASCFSMAVSAELGKAGITPRSIETKATVSLEKAEVGFEVKRSHLEVVVQAPGADRAKVEAATEAAKTGCPLSKALRAIEVTMSARYEV
jgi:lipoyl-dependent peroxiredoxin